MFFSRGKNKLQEPYTLKDMYKEYIKDKEESSPYYIEYAKFVSIVSKFYKNVLVYIREGGVYKLPYSMGTLLIVKYRPKKRTITNTPIDWYNTNKYGKIIRFTNDHSNYFKFMFNWNKSTCRVVNKTLYRFVPVRSFKRELASMIKTGNHDFFEL